MMMQCKICRSWQRGCLWDNPFFSVWEAWCKSCEMIYREILLDDDKNNNIMREYL